MAESNIIPPLDHPDGPHHRRLLAGAIHGLFDGRSNNVGTVTLADGATTTNIDDKRIGPESVILLVPLTANAANLDRTSDVFISARTNEQATITHGNTVNADQDFAYIVVSA